MKRLNTALLWLWLLTKRLFHRPAFWVMLVLIPTLVLGYAAIDTEDSGMLTVAVAQEGHAAPDPHLLQALKGDGQLLRYQPCDTPDQARALVVAGKVDTAWIFPEDIEKYARAFVANPSPKTAFIQAVVREDSVMLRLARERLSGTTFPAIARQVYLAFLRQIAPELDSLTDRQLLDRYDAVAISENLFSYDEAYAQLLETHYLLSPLRGLLGIVILLCALAAALYHYRDVRIGTFGRLSRRWQWTAELAGQWVTTFAMATAAAACLALTDLSAGLFRESALVVLYSLCCAAFAMLLRRLLGSVRLLAALLPALVVLMLVVCPVFFDLNALLPVRLLFPPTYYIYGAHQPGYLLILMGYVLLCFGLYALIGRLPGKKETP